MLGRKLSKLIGFCVNTYQLELFVKLDNWMFAIQRVKVYNQGNFSLPFLLFQEDVWLLQVVFELHPNLHLPTELILIDFLFLPKA